MGKPASVYLSDPQLKMIEDLSVKFSKPTSEIIRVLMHLGYSELMKHPADTEQKETIGNVLIDLYKQEINK